MKACAGAAPGRLALQMDQTDYYITAVQGHPLTPAESTYNYDNVALTAANLEGAIEAAISFDQLPPTPSSERPDTIKVLAYFLAESARFASVEQVDTALLAGSCSAQWADYAHLVRRWSVLSKFAIHLATNDWTARQGHLVAPVNDAVVTAYNAAVAAGQSGPNAQYVYVDRNGHWDTPIQLQQVACGR